MDTSAVIILRGVGVSTLGERAQLAVILSHMVVVIAPAAWARARPRMRTQRQSWARTTPSSGQIVRAWQRGLVIMQGFVALFLGVIALVIILLFVEIAALQVLVVALRMIMALIILMMIVRLAIIAIVLIAFMVVAIFVATMLLVAWFTATRGRKISHFLLFWLLLVLGDLLENASCLVGCLTLPEESNQLERVSRHCLVQVRELEMMRLGLCKENLFTLLLRHGYFHHLTKIATLKIAEKLYSTLHEFLHRHESGLLGHTKPASQLVPYIGKTGNSLKVIPDALVKVCLHKICIIWTLLCNDASPCGRAYVLKALTHEVKQ